MSFTKAFQGFVSSAKDAGTNAMAGRMIRRYIEKYGELQAFEINSAQKWIDVELLLKGESGPVRVTIENYELARKGEKLFLRLNRLKASREWLHLVLQDYGAGREIEIPAQYSSAIEMAL
ncbi:MAG: hypothetical protein SFY81_08160 [Verrucomicrobiota bacterium]|nr:hypothetical protein [Verrucomicrobiota bacterium]